MKAITPFRSRMSVTMLSGKLESLLQGKMDTHSRFLLRVPCKLTGGFLRLAAVLSGKTAGFVHSLMGILPSCFQMGAFRHH
ncbi:hypothetical protein [Sphaerochaeta pleomorpha]|uniref:hypothetical protein n=1 Tax=Sphaerochaeta pleomorpha TaxID=1131707 RepID=UPI003CCB1FAA